MQSGPLSCGELHTFSHESVCGKKGRSLGSEWPHPLKKGNFANYNLHEQFKKTKFDGTTIRNLFRYELQKFSYMFSTVAGFNREVESHIKKLGEGV